MSDSDSTSRLRAAEAKAARKTSLAELLKVSLDNRAIDPHAPPGTEAEPGARAAGEAAAAAPESVTAEKPADAQATPEASATIAKTPAAIQAREAKPEAAAEPRPTQPGGKLAVVGRIASLALVATGGLLLVLPHVSTWAAQTLANHSELRAQAGPLIIAGLCLFTFGLLRQALGEIRDRMDAEVARVQKIALDGHAVRSTLEGMSAETSTVTGEIVQLQVRLRKLTEIVSSPEFTVSIFRLAASVDQLGKQVDTSMKSQFVRIYQQLEELAGRMQSNATAWTGALGVLTTRMADHHGVQQLAAKQGFERIREIAEASGSRIERIEQLSTQIESLIQQQREQVSSGFTGLTEGSERDALELANAMDELRAQVSGLLQGDLAKLQARLEQVDGRLEQGQRNLTTTITQHSDRARSHLAQHVEDMRDGLNQLGRLAGSNHQEVVGEVRGLVERIEQSTSQHAEALGQACELAERASTAAKEELALELERLRGPVERIEHSTTQHAAALGQAREQAERASAAARAELGAELERLREHVQRIEQSTSRHDAALGQAREHAERTSAAAKDELVLELERLRELVDALSEAQCSKILEGTQQATGAIARLVGAELQALDAKLELHAREQEVREQEAAIAARRTTEEACASLTVCIEQVGLRIEEQLATRSIEPVVEASDAAFGFAPREWFDADPEAESAVQDPLGFAAGLELDASTPETGPLGAQDAPPSADREPAGDGDLDSGEFRYP